VFIFFEVDCLAITKEKEIIHHAPGIDPLEGDLRNRLMYMSPFCIDNDPSINRKIVGVHASLPIQKKPPSIPVKSYTVQVIIDPDLVEHILYDFHLW
jgi:hypothetical protein